MTAKSRKVPGTKYIPSETGYKPGARSVWRDQASTQARTIRIFGQEIAEYLKISLGTCEVQRFSNENIFGEAAQLRARAGCLSDPSRMSSPVNDNIMEMLITIDALKRDSAGRITAVILTTAMGAAIKRSAARADHSAPDRRYDPSGRRRPLHHY